MTSLTQTQSPIRILITGEPIDQIDEFSQALENAGLTVDLVACSSVGALMAQLDNIDTPADLMLIPCGSSRIHASALVHTLRNHEFLLPIILLASPGMEDEIAHTLEAGANGYLLMDESGRYKKLLPAVIKQALHPKPPTKTDLNSSLLDQLLDTVEQAVILTDDAGNITFWNQYAEKLTGWKEDEVMGRDALDITLSPGDEVLGQGILKLLRAHTSWSGELIVQCKNADSIPVRITALPIRHLQGQVIGGMILATDLTTQRQTEKSLLESEEKYRQLSEYATEWILVHDLSGKISYLNPAALKFGGYTQTDITNLTLRDLVPPDQYDQLHQRQLQRLNGDMGTINYETVLVTHTGEHIPVEVTSTPIVQTPQAGPFNDVLVIARDISDRKQMEDTLRQSEAKFRRVVEKSADGIALTDEDGITVEWNQSQERITGYQRDEMIGLPAWEAQFRLAPPENQTEEYRQFLQTNMQTALQDGKAPWLNQVHPLEIMTAGNKKRTVESLSYAIPGEKGWTIGTATRDITESKNTSERLRLQGAAIESAANAILIADREWNILYVNPALTRLSGYTLEEARGGKPRDLFNSGIYDPEFYNQMDLVLLSGEVWQGQLTNRCKNGEFYIEEMTITPVKDDGGRISHFIAIKQDISDRVARERELEGVGAVSAALRGASTRAEMLPIILAKLITLLEATGTSFAMRDPLTGETVIELGHGASAALTGVRIPPGMGITGQVIASGELYVNDDINSDPRLMLTTVNQAFQSVICAPLTIHEEVIGSLWIGRTTNPLRNSCGFQEAEIRLVRSIADIAANAIHRATLHEQTTLQLKRLNTLNIIERVISTSLDLNVTLNVLMDQIVPDLRVDAADLLLFNPQTHSLKYIVNRGFSNLNENIINTHLMRGPAGKVVIERKPIFLKSIEDFPLDSPRKTLLASRGLDNYYGIPLVSKGQIKGVLELFQAKPFQMDPDWLDFVEALAGQVSIAIELTELFDDLQSSNIELAMAYDTTLEGWSRALDLRDKETEGHTRRVTELSTKLAGAMGLDDVQVVQIRRGAILHDIGKMGIPDSILLKPGPLTDEEWKIMRMHPTYAYQLLSPIAYLRGSLDIPYCHHERWDGGGYPRGLSGEQIPLAARIFCLVDVWDALSSDRPYRKRWTQEDVLAYIRSESGKHFDPNLIEAFLSIIQELPPEN